MQCYCNETHYVSIKNIYPQTSPPPHTPTLLFYCSLLLNAGIKKNSSNRGIGDYLSFFTESCFLILSLLLSVTNLESQHTASTYCQRRLLFYLLAALGLEASTFFLGSLSVCSFLQEQQRHLLIVNKTKIACPDPCLLVT